MLHKNSELGLEKQYFEYMAQGSAVDYAHRLAGAHVHVLEGGALHRRAVPLPRPGHWNKVLDQDMLKPVADEVAQKADVMLIGYAGGGTRNIFANKPVRNLAEMQGPQGPRAGRADLVASTFAAVGMSPTVIAYNEIYNAIQNSVIDAGENEAAGVEPMRFYEVAPNLAMTSTRSPSGRCASPAKTFASCRHDLQAAILKAGKEAGAYGRQLESGEDSQKVETLEKAGKLRASSSPSAPQMKKLVDPVMAAYAKEIDAEGILAKINALTA